MNEYYENENENFDPYYGLLITVLAGFFMLTPFAPFAFLFFPIGLFLFGPASYTKYKNNKLIADEERIKEIADEERKVQILECNHHFYWVLKKCSTRRGCLCVDAGGGSPNIRNYLDSDRLFTTIKFEPFEKDDEIIHISKSIFDDTTLDKFYIDQNSYKDTSIIKPRAHFFNNIDGLYLKLLDEDNFPETGIVLISDDYRFYQILNLKFNIKYFHQGLLISNDHKGTRVCFFCNFSTCGKCLDARCQSSCSNELRKELYKLN